MNCSGVYFLASRFLDGSYIYKVGKAGCIKDRINQYPQNFDLILQFECTNKNISEREVIKVVENLKNIGITKCERGNEYFRSEKDMIREIKLAIYDWYYEIERSRTKEPTVEPIVESLSLVEERVSGPPMRGFLCGRRVFKRQTHCTGEPGSPYAGERTRTNSQEMHGGSEGKGGRKTKK